MQPRMEPRFNPRAAQNNRFGNRQSAPAQARRNFAPSGGSTFAGGILSFSIDGRSNRRTFALFSVITLVLLMFGLVFRLDEIESYNRRVIAAQDAAAEDKLASVAYDAGAALAGWFFWGADPLSSITVARPFKTILGGGCVRTVEEVEPIDTLSIWLAFVPAILLMVYSWIFVLGRRLHDLGFSAHLIFLIWFLTAFFSCFVSGLCLLLVVGVFSFVPGNVGMNEYGYPPERKFFP